MRKILIIITITILVFFLFLIRVKSKERSQIQRVKDYSDVPLAKYTLQEWEDLGVNVWEKYYSPERWKELEAKSSWINDYELGWKGHLDFILEKKQEKGIVIEEKNIEIWAKPLYEEVLPIHRWFWSDIKLRIFTCECTIVYNGEKLRIYYPSLPSTEGTTVQK